MEKKIKIGLICLMFLVTPMVATSWISCMPSISEEILSNPDLNLHISEGDIDITLDNSLVDKKVDVFFDYNNISECLRIENRMRCMLPKFKAGQHNLQLISENKILYEANIYFPCDSDYRSQKATELYTSLALFFLIVFSPFLLLSLILRRRVSRKYILLFIIMGLIIATYIVMLLGPGISYR